MNYKSLIISAIMYSLAFISLIICLITIKNHHIALLLFFSIISLRGIYQVVIEKEDRNFPLIDGMIEGISVFACFIITTVTF